MIQPAISVFFLVQLASLWAALFVTGRIYGLLTSTHNASMKDDALASLVIVAITTVASLLVFVLPIPNVVGFVDYFGLIYHAFQLDGLFDLFVFYCLHGIFLVAFSWIGLLSLMQGKLL